MMTEWFDWYKTVNVCSWSSNTIPSTFTIWLHARPHKQCLGANPSVTGHLSEGSFVRNGVVQIPKFDTKPNPDHSPNPNSNLTLYVSDKWPFRQVNCPQIHLLSVWRSKMLVDLDLMQMCAQSTHLYHLPCCEVCTQTC